MSTVPEPGLELTVPTLGDVSVKYTWTIRKYARAIKKRESFDSPAFEHNANGLRTRWNVSVCFWKGPDGKRVRNPAVVCLNLLACEMEGQAQARLRFQFGVFNADVRRWESCRASHVALNLETSDRLLSVGHCDMSVLDRHESRPHGDVSLCVALCVAPTDEEDATTLSHDLSRLLGEGDVTLRCDAGAQYRAHSVLLRARSPVWAAMLDRAIPTLDRATPTVDVGAVTPATLAEVLRFVYTDHVEDATCPALLAAADRFALPGLKAACERALMETIIPSNVPSLLLVADRYECQALKHALLAYCEDNVAVVNKSVAWRVMELVNPELFGEVCEEAGLGSSLSSDLESLASDSGITGL